MHPRSAGEYRGVLEARLQYPGGELRGQEVKNVPGRKTDMCDAEWLVELLRHGLIRGSFIPPEPIRVLRDLTRYRKKASEVSRPGCQHQIGQRSNGHRRRIG
ncbi:MAG: transposase [Bacillota bacterium]